MINAEARAEHILSDGEHNKNSNDTPNSAIQLAGGSKRDDLPPPLLNKHNAWEWVLVIDDEAHAEHCLVG